MIFLWVVVIVMAVALAAEIFALAGMGLVARGAARRAAAMKNELAERLHPSIRTAKELKITLAPHIDVLRRDGKEVVSVLSSRFRTLKAAYQDVDRRVQRVRLRLNTDGAQTVEQMQHSNRLIRRGIVVPIRTAVRVAGGISATLWLLRKVA